MPRCISRSQMEAIIAGGSSIQHLGRTITRKEDLPSEAEIAALDPE